MLNNRKYSIVKSIQTFKVKLRLFMILCLFDTLYIHNDLDIVRLLRTLAFRKCMHLPVCDA